MPQSLLNTAFEAVGHAVDIQGKPHPVRGCIQCIRGAGIVCVLGLSNDPEPLLMKELIWKEAKIIALRVTHGEFGVTIQHMNNGRLNPDVLISTEMPA